MSSVADRLLTALSHDYALFVEVAERIALIPRCDQWEPHKGQVGAFTRSDSQGSVIAMVQPKAGGGASYFLRADIGVGKEALSVAQAKELADTTLFNKGWVFPPAIGG